jgi:GNAT superfamily N-acetyltransferase
MEIRRLRASDLPLCEEMGKSFVEEGKVAGGFRIGEFRLIWEAVLQSGYGAIFGAFNGDGKMVGALGAMAAPDPNNGDLVTHEAFWFVSAEERRKLNRVGLRLLKAYNAWCQEIGAKRQRMSTLLRLKPKKLDKLYRRLGYHPVEVQYEKAVEV